MAFTMMSDRFATGESIPVRFTCDGANVNPPLAWNGIPNNTQSLVLIMDDPDASTGPGGEPITHWVLYNIPPGQVQISENTHPGGTFGGEGIDGRNTRGQEGYAGPCPPQGSMHHYYFRLYALDRGLDIGPGADRAQIMDAMRDHILDHTELMGTYHRV